MSYLTMKRMTMNYLMTFAHAFVEGAHERCPGSCLQGGGGGRGVGGGGGGGVGVCVCGGAVVRRWALHSRGSAACPCHLGSKVQRSERKTHAHVTLLAVCRGGGREGGGAPW